MNPSSKNGFIFGLLCPGMWGGKREPVAYLYNGVRLPKLPEWDKETYPYAVIIQDNFLLAYAVRPYFNGNGVTTTVTSGIWAYSVADGKWEFMVAGELVPGDEFSAVWTNTDILNADSTVYLAASEPVPIYE